MEKKSAVLLSLSADQRSLVEVCAKKKRGGLQMTLSWQQQWRHHSLQRPVVACLARVVVRAPLVYRCMCICASSPPTEWSPWRRGGISHLGNSSHKSFCAAWKVNGFVGFLSFSSLHQKRSLNAASLLSFSVRCWQGQAGNQRLEDWWRKVLNDMDGRSSWWEKHL